MDLNLDEFSIFTTKTNYVSNTILLRRNSCVLFIGRGSGRGQGDNELGFNAGEPSH